MSIRTLVVFLLALSPSLATAQTQTAPSPDPGPQLHFGGYVQYDYLAPLGDDTQTEDTFRLRRVRLSGTGTLNKDIGWTVTAEATSSPVLRDAYLTFRYFPAATVRAGQFVMPYGIEQYQFSSNSLPFTERLLIELIASRDAGVAVSNERPFFGWFSYAAAVINGTRQNNADNNSAKDGILRLTAAPRRLPGFQVSINAMKGDQPEGMRTRTGADVSFERRRFHVAAEFDRERTGGSPEKRGGYVFGAWRLYPRSDHRGFHHLEFGTRLGRTTRLTTPVNQWDIAANYYVQANLRFMCDFIVHTNRAAGVPPATFHARANIRF